jgi:hypothetical protein
MVSRVFFLTICVFWLAMNFLLWRSQWGDSSRIGNEAPLNVIWQKILTAPDNSSLDVYDHDKKIGFCHWTVISGEAAAANQRLQEDYAPGDAPPLPTAYALALDGSIAPASSNRIRFDARLTLAPTQQWRDFHLRVNTKPIVWDAQASASSQRVNLWVDASGARWVRSFTFAELANPQAVLQELGGPMALALPGAPGLPSGTNELGGLIATLHWQAHEDHIQFGHSRVRVYRLDAQWLGQRLHIFVSLVGEILWVELPNGVSLRHEAFDHF